MTTRHLRPDRDEIAVVLARPGEAVTVTAKSGEVVEIPERDEAWLVFVPYDATAVGWDWQLRSSSHAVGPADARTPTGLRAGILQRILRGHKLDEPVWTEARRLLGDGPVYLRYEAVPYYSRTRWAAVAVRSAEEAS